MTLERIDAWEVVVPAHPGAINSESLGNFLSHPWDLLPIVVLEVTFADGVTGLGEIGRGVTLAAVDDWLKELPGARLSGLSPRGLPVRWRGEGTFGGAIEDRLPAPLAASPSPVASALEMAQLDACGKRLNCRAVDLLGGAYRERIAVDYWCGRKTPDDLRDTVARAREMGFAGLKMKSKQGDPTEEQLEAIKAEGGEDFAVTIDPMYQWFGPAESLHTLKRLERFSHVRVEDPFPEDMPAMWRRARQTCAVPLILHARSLGVLRRGLSAEMADAYNVSGGAFDFLTVAHAVEVAGYTCWRGSSLELGIGQAAGLHAAAAARACVMASDFQSGVIREHTLITWDWPYDNGFLPLPSGPGLGIELDRAALRRYRRAEATYAV